MPLNDQQQARFDYLNQLLGPMPSAPAPPQLGIGPRISEGLANVPSNVAQGLTSGVTSLMNLGQEPGQEFHPYQVPAPYNIPPPQTFGQRAADLIPGLASTVLTAAIPGGLMRSGLSALGASPGLAAFGGEAFAGGFLGAPSGAAQAASLGGQFGLLGAINTAPIPGWLKALGNVAVPVGGQLLSGQDPLSQESLLNTGASLVVPGLLGGYGGRGADTGEPLLGSQDNQPAPQPSNTNANSQFLLGYSPQPNEVRGGVVYGQGPLLSSDMRFQMPGYAPPGTGEIPPPQPMLQAPRTLADAAHAGDIVTYNGQLGSVDQGEDGQFYVTGDDGTQRLYGNLPDTPLHQIEGLTPEVTGDRAPIPDAPPFQRDLTVPHTDSIIDPSVAPTTDEETAAPSTQSLDTHHDQVAQAIQSFADNYPVNTVLARGFDDLPPEVQQTVQKSGYGGDMEGFYLPSKDTHYFLSDNISNPARAEKVAVHEITHGAVDRILTPDQFNQIASDVVNRNTPMVHDIARTYTGAPEDAVEAQRHIEQLQPDQRRVLTREYIARLAENTDLDPTLWQKVTAFVRARLRDLGINREWSDAEIQDLIRKAHRSTKAGESPAEGSIASMRGAPDSVDPSLPRRMDEAAKDQEENKKTLLGAISRWAEANLGLSSNPTIKRVLEQAKGAEGTSVEKVNAATEGLLGYAKQQAKGQPLLQPHEEQALSRFANSKGNSVDKAQLLSANIPKPVENFALVHKEQQIIGQQAKASAETGGKQATTIKNMGDYLRRTYQLFADPKTYGTRFARGDYDKALDDAVQYSKAKPEFAGLSDDFLRTQWKQVLKNLQDNKPFSENSTAEKISQSLYVSKKDLTRDQWSTMEGLQTDPRLSTHDQGLIADAVRKQHVDPATQKRLGEIADGGALTKPESQALSEISEKETVDPRVRALFGEYTNPVDQIAWTSQKVMRSFHQAKAISDMAKVTLPDGRKLAYDTPQELEAAMKGATGDTKRALMRYKELPETDGYGVLSGKWADVGVHDTLDSFNQGMSAGADQIWGKVQKVLKLNATVLNPATHAHWWMQMPLMMAMARSYNPAEWVRAGQIVLGSDQKNAAIREELTRNNILQVGAQRDLGGNARTVSTLQEPDTAFSKIKTGGDKALAWLGKMYGHPDDIIRTAAYLGDKARALKDGLSEQDAQNRAVDFTNKYTFNYDAVSKGVKFASNIPTLNPFLTYSAELARITKNIARDVISGSASDRMHGALNLALMAAVPLAASLGSSQMNLSPKDQQDWDRTRKLEDEDQKAQIKFVLGRNKDGSFHYVDIAPMLPSSDTFTMAKNIATGNWKGFAENQPIIGLQHSPIASLGIDLSTGTNQFTGQKLFTPGDYASRIWQGVTPPLLGSQAARDIKSFSPNSEGGLGLTNPRTGRQDTPVTSLLGHMGVRLQSEQMPQLLQAALAEAQDKQASAKGQFMQVSRPDATQAAKDAAAKRYSDRLKNINQDLLSKIGQ